MDPWRGTVGVGRRVRFQFVAVLDRVVVDVADDSVHLAESQDHLCRTTVLAPSALVWEFFRSVLELCEDSVQISLDKRLGHDVLVERLMFGPAVLDDSLLVSFDEGGVEHRHDALSRSRCGFRV